MAHYKRKGPRTKSSATGQFPNGAPAHWNIIYHSRPRRRRDKAACIKIMKGADADGMVLDLGNSKPHKYYW